MSSGISLRSVDACTCRACDAVRGDWHPQIASTKRLGREELPGPGREGSEQRSPVSAAERESLPRDDDVDRPEQPDHARAARLLWWHSGP